MKEIRTIKMVEHTEVKFVADDGTEFTGKNAERNCKDHERTCDKLRVTQLFNRLDFKEVKLPFVDWFCDDNGFYTVALNSKNDYVTMMDYFNVVWGVYYNNIKEPVVYPYVMTVSYSCESVCEYNGNLAEELRTALEQF